MSSPAPSAAEKLDFHGLHGGAVSGIRRALKKRVTFSESVSTKLYSVQGTQANDSGPHLPPPVARDDSRGGATLQVEAASSCIYGRSPGDAVFFNVRKQLLDMSIHLRTREKLQSVMPPLCAEDEDALACRRRKVPSKLAALLEACENQLVNQEGVVAN